MNVIIAIKLLPKDFQTQQAAPLPQFSSFENQQSAFVFKASLITKESLTARERRRSRTMSCAKEFLQNLTCDTQMNIEISEHVLERFIRIECRYHEFCIAKLFCPYQTAVISIITIIMRHVPDESSYEARLEFFFGGRHKTVMKFPGVSVIMKGMLILTYTFIRLLAKTKTLWQRADVLHKNKGWQFEQRRNRLSNIEIILKSPRRGTRRINTS
jgi:hypothetical protein